MRRLTGRRPPFIKSLDDVAREIFPSQLDQSIAVLIPSRTFEDILRLPSVELLEDYYVDGLDILRMAVLTLPYNKKFLIRELLTDPPHIDIQMDAERFTRTKQKTLKRMTRRMGLKADQIEWRVSPKSRRDIKNLLRFRKRWQKANRTLNL